MLITDELRNRILETNLQQPRMFNGSQTNPHDMTQGLLDLILENITPDMTIAEIGSFAGVSSQLFAIHCKELYCIDTWAENPEYKNETIKLAEKLFDIIDKHHDNVHKIKNTSQNASDMFEDNSIDLVYIDADHSYDSVKNDIAYWYPKVKPGSLLAGHDYWIHDVKRAVDEIQPPIKVYNDSSWIIRK